MLHNLNIGIDTHYNDNGATYFIYGVEELKIKINKNIVYQCKCGRMSRMRPRSLPRTNPVQRARQWRPKTTLQVSVENIPDTGQHLDNRCCKSAFLVWNHPFARLSNRQQEEDLQRAARRA